MTTPFFVLLRGEVRRLSTLTSLLTALLLTVVNVVMVLVNRNAGLSDQLVQFVNGLIIPFGVPFLCAGMVAYDVQSHWLRTVLMRPVQRSEYLLARITAVFLFATALILIAGVLPAVAVPPIAGRTLMILPSRSLPTLVFLIGHAYLVIVLLAFLSCYMPGILNIVALGVWALSSLLLGQYVHFKLWDNAFMNVAKDFFFPSGFQDAAQAAAQHQPEVLTPALWGLAAAIAFTAVACWSVTRVQVESGSE